MKLVSKVLAVVLAAVIFCSCRRDSDTLFRLLPPDETGIEFANEIVESDTFNILTYEYIYNGGGVGIADFDNNGLKDIFFAGNIVPNRLYLNRGKLSFEDVTATAGVNVEGRWNSGVAVVDINNDGWMDVYVTATMKAAASDRRNMMFINNGLNNDGVPTFTDQAESFGIDDEGYSVTAAFLDYDRDGDLDLYILTNQRMDKVPTSYRPKIADGSAVNNDRLYRNNGNATFTNVTIEAGILLEGFGLGLGVSDLNKDGWPDIYVSNDYLSNDILYINNRNGTFTNRIAEYIGHQSQFSMGNDIADINNDGLSDIITTDMLPETNFRKKTTIGNKSYSTYIYNDRFGYEYQYVRNMLHLNNGLGQGIPFSEVGQLAGIHQTEWSWSPLFVDLDNDGLKDLIVTNGFPKDVTDKDFANYRADVGNIASPGFLNDSIPIVKIPNYAFRNEGNLVFRDATTKWGLGEKSFSNGAAFADLDNDGDIDYVTNNINDKAFVFENLLSVEGEKAGSSGYLNLALVGTSQNRQALGAKVTLFSNGGIQYSECSAYRGFLSSVDHSIHFGLGSNRVDSVLVEWPDGTSQKLIAPKANQTITVEYEPGGVLAARVEPDPEFREISRERGIDFIHNEEDFIDFNLQRTLPHKFSQAGPGLAAGDINGDGLEDLLVGGSVGRQLSVMFQQKDGSFRLRSKQTPDAAKRTEDQGLLLFDADGDDDLDLYVVSGGFESNAPSDLTDRLLLNDGKGNLKEAVNALPDTGASGSCVRAADFDVDGDLDLFVGGRVVPGAYPMPARSYILRNEGGKFIDVTTEVCPALELPGLVVDALWSDYDGDGKRDLVVVGEFMPVMFYHNDGGTFSTAPSTGIENQAGWWNSIVSADYDHDGDVDYAVGNVGWNNNYQVSAGYPLKVFAKDFDGNGSVDPVMACYMRESMDDTVKQLFPVHFWDEMNSQSPAFRRKFTRYKQFGKATVDVLLTQAELAGAVVLEANRMGSVYIENLGAGKFAMRDLPVSAQVSPVYGMVAEDVNGDGNADLLIVGNDYGNEVFAGKYDAGVGGLLIGKGDGTFDFRHARETGFLVPGDAKALVKLATLEGSYYIASQNKGRLLAFQRVKDDLVTFTPGADDSWAEFTSPDGRRTRVELHYGSGYLSQSSRVISIPKNTVELKIFDWGGKSRTVKVPVRS
jgi:hypothetical protein